MPFHARGAARGAAAVLIWVFAAMLALIGGPSAYAVPLTSSLATPPATELTTPPRHTFEITETVAQQFHNESLRELRADPGDENTAHIK